MEATILLFLSLAFAPSNAPPGQTFNRAKSGTKSHARYPFSCWLKPLNTSDSRIRTGKACVAYWKAEILTFEILETFKFINIFS